MHIKDLGSHEIPGSFIEEEYKKFKYMLEAHEIFGRQVCFI